MKKDHQKYIINCAGERVAVTGSGYTSRCAIGNTDDYLENFRGYIIDEIAAMGRPASIMTVIPSYASDQEELCRTLISLCLQHCQVPHEIMVFINEPGNATESARMVNDHNERFFREVRQACECDDASTLSEAQRSIFAACTESGDSLTLRVVRQTVCGGLAGVYQNVTASMIARARTFCDGQTQGAERHSKVKAIEESLKRSMLLFCDDDMEIKDRDAVSNAYRHVVQHDAVVLGHLRISRVETGSIHREILRDLMQLFLDLKQDHGLNFLTPRGILLSGILRVGAVQIGQPFADQLFFAAAARGRTPYFLKGETSVSESDYPGNGNFLKKLRLYLEGEVNDGLDIFENVLKRYREDQHIGRYCADDIENLIVQLKTRDQEKIKTIVGELLAER